MFELTSYLSPIELEHAIKDILIFTKENGGVSKKELIIRLSSHTAIQDGDDKIGWGFEQIISLGSHKKFDQKNMCIVLLLEEPVRLNCSHAVCVGRGLGLCSDCDGRKLSTLLGLMGK